MVVGDIEEEKKNPADQYEGLNKKQKKIMNNLKSRSTKRMMFVQPDTDWAMHNVKLAYMESSRDENDNKVFEFVERDVYKDVQREFKAIQQTHDIQALMFFLSKNYFHHESLIYVSDFLRMQGKFPDAVKLIQRCMYAFEVLFSKDFTAWGPRPNTRINFDSQKSNLGNIFADCLVRYIDHLGRKGCVRTALEITKFFLSLDPERDPFGNLLKIDFYALRSGEYKYLSNFAEKFSNEFHRHPLKTILFSPNILLSTAVARFKLAEKVNDRTVALEKAHSSINEFVSLIHEKAWEESPKILKALYALSAEALFMMGMVFYPTLVKLILMKVEVEKKPNICKSFYTGMQKEPWAKIMGHEFFEFDEDDEVLEHSLGLDSDVLSKYFDLYTDLTSEWYKDDELLEWMKQVIGFTLNENDSEDFDREVMFQFIFNSVGLPYELKRYAGLKKEFFNDFQTVDPQELLGNGPEANDVGGMNQAEFQANIQNVMNNQNLPPQVAQVPINQGMPPVDHDNLIMEDENAMMEQEAIMQHIMNQQRANQEEEEFLIMDAGDDEVRKQQDDE